MKEIKLSEKDIQIFEEVRKNVGLISPTEIGMKLGKPYNSASSYCSGSLKKLMEAGKVIRIKADGKIKYKVNYNNK
jgi:DNA-binding Lrp family transcriptional regulator